MLDIFLLPALLFGFWLLFASWSPVVHDRRRGPTSYQANSARLGHEMALVGCGAVALALAIGVRVTERIR